MIKVILRIKKVDELMKQLTLVSMLCAPAPRNITKQEKNAWTEKLVYDRWENERTLGSHASRTVINKSFMRLVLRDYPHRRDVG